MGAKEEVFHLHSSHPCDAVCWWRSDRNVLSSPMQILSLRCYWDQLCGAMLDKNALSMFSRSFMREEHIRVHSSYSSVPHYTILHIHARTHTYTHACTHAGRIAFMQSSSIMVGTSQSRGRIRDQSCLRLRQTISHAGCSCSATVMS